ncbi:serine/threonine protein kinase [Ktedonosporobacter rubrisoli]|uniref:non-specific serine/threonine protein kinase n=1 Tax=Ktedonosporobacter rubrisoli TaxID=2509675 RepID=A0A4P6K4E9_KTERU|nr:serine/threonine-protein kinase [Ktedonosporobacter rubrisoli]QBD83188.1 serine/threonine protein kinase [Ktedonosporobacter rubrisoli]
MIETVPSGTVLHGRYRIERVLGSGGFGHVYLAVDLMTSQQYAVKEYLVTGASGQEQLKHEATVLSQLHNPHLPAFQDAFMERGRYYVVLNYIEGHDLTDLIRHARQRNDTVPIPRIMEWILAICDAVLFLHSQRPPVIHRDIKPDNIRITSNGTAILVDLGNAKAAADGARTLFFIRHQGTPGYAPPNSIQEEAAPTRALTYTHWGAHSILLLLRMSRPVSLYATNRYSRVAQIYRLYKIF